MQRFCFFTIILAALNLGWLDSTASGQLFGGNQTDSAFSFENNNHLVVPESHQPAPSFIEEVYKGFQDAQGQQPQWQWPQQQNQQWQQPKRPQWQQQYQQQPQWQQRPQSNQIWNKPPAQRYKSVPQINAPPRAVVKKNAPPISKPKLKLADVKKNPFAKPAIASLAQIDGTDDLIEANTNQKIDEMEDRLSAVNPQIAQDPAVQAALATLKLKNSTGQEITQADFDVVRDAAAIAMNKLVPPIANNQKLPFFQAIEQSSGAVVQLSALRAQLQPGTTGIGWIVYNPVFPIGNVVVLPSGALMTGCDCDELAMEQGTAAEALGLPLSEAPPMPEAKPYSETAMTSGVLVRNPTDAVCHYVLNDQYPYTMNGGESQQLPAGSWIIKFDKGTTGEVEYTLNDGTYRFGEKDGGWDLTLQTFDVTLDNSENPGPFEYVLDDKNCVVEAKGRSTHQSNYPLVIRFDRGGDAETAVKQVNDRNVTLRIAVDKRDQLWQLFPADGEELATAAE